ncbi:protein of unknown function [Aminobacter niigataensis]|nr:protein of unknown function [Aminobacter niigataensis]
MGYLERVKRFERSTPTLARSFSTYAAISELSIKHYFSIAKSEYRSTGFATATRFFHPSAYILLTWML